MRKAKAMAKATAKAKAKAKAKTKAIARTYFRDKRKCMKSMGFEWWGIDLQLGNAKAKAKANAKANAVEAARFERRLLATR